MNIKKEDINKKIYFLDNIYQKIFEKHYEHNNLKELNEYNTELYINNKKYEFKKYFIPNKEGEYKINIKFNNNLIELTDLSYMFVGCDKIININFISFIIKNKINMKYMFYECKNLKQINILIN